MIKTNAESSVLGPNANLNYDVNVYNSYFKVLMDPLIIIVQKFAPILDETGRIYSKIEEGRTDIFIVTKKDPKTIIHDVAVAESNIRVFLKSLEPSCVYPDYEFHVIRDEGQPFGAEYKIIFPLASPKTVHLATYAIQTGPSWPSPTKRAISSLF